MSLEGGPRPSIAEFARKQAELFEATDGADGAEFAGLPIIVLTSTGAKSGLVRKTPLMRVEHEGEYAVVASLGGAPKHPVWYFNLVKTPEVQLQDGAEKADYTAREVTGHEKAVWWERAVAAYPAYAEHQQKADRQIPIFVLSRR